MHGCLSRESVLAQDEWFAAPETPPTDSDWPLSAVLAIDEPVSVRKVTPERTSSGYDFPRETGSREGSTRNRGRELPRLAIVEAGEPEDLGPSRAPAAVWHLSGLLTNRDSPRGTTVAQSFQ